MKRLSEGKGLSENPGPEYVTIRAFCELHEVTSWMKSTRKRLRPEVIGYGPNDCL